MRGRGSLGSPCQLARSPSLDAQPMGPELGVRGPWFSWLALALIPTVKRPSPLRGVGGTASDVETPCNLSSTFFVEGPFGPTERRVSQPLSYS